MQGVKSSIVYQKAAAVCPIPETDISDEVNALGGLGAVAGSSVTAGEGSYSVKAPIVIMDDAGFREYCEQIGITLTALNALEAEIMRIFGREYIVESENRIQEKISDENIQKGFMLILGTFCALLAIVGIANVFSNTLGFLRQRKREFAQYMSVGMTLESMRKMFCIEALAIAGRPLLITLPLTVLSVSFMITASYLNPMEFLVKVPIVIFILAIFGFVSLAYYIGGKRLLDCSLADALRNDYAV